MLPTTPQTTSIAHWACTALAAGALAGGLAGCATPPHQAPDGLVQGGPQQAFPPPGAGVPSCLALPGTLVQASLPERALHDLVPGARCWFIVQPGQQLGMAGNGTGLALHPRCRYTVTFPAEPGALTASVLPVVPPPHPVPALMAAASESDGAQPVHHGARLTGMQGELSFHVPGERASQGQLPQHGKLVVIVQRDAGGAQGRGCDRRRG